MSSLLDLCRFSLGLAQPLQDRSTICTPADLAVAETYIEIEFLLLMIGKQPPSKAAFTQHPHELNPSSRRDGSLEDFPTLFAVHQCHLK